MKKLIFVYVITFIFSIACSPVVTDLGMLKALAPGMPNTITLSNGKVVYDLNGEWDALYEYYGTWSEYAKHPDVVKITQKGDVFVGVKQIGNTYVGKGEESVRGELAESGFKKVQVLTARRGYFDCTGKISEDGNKIIIDDGQVIRVTLNRK